jgi:MFS family permease
VGITVAATLPLIGNSLKVDSSQLGIVLSTFVAGVGIFQILAGFGALKWGTREVYLIGLTLVGVANLLSGFSNNIIELAILRFAVGIGAALASGTAFSLLASYYPAGVKGVLFRDHQWAGWSYRSSRSISDGHRLRMVFSTRICGSSNGRSCGTLS